MAVIKCKMCGGDLVIEPGATVAECEYCGTKQTIPNQDDEKKLTLFARANRLRMSCEFDKAAGIYESIVADFPQEAEAYWGLVLCKYGIEYVDDPATGKKIPTCHRSSFESIMEDSDFEQALENADVVARKVYRDEAKQIEEIRKGIIEVSGKEEPYDIFICYKETDENGQRTVDSVIAQDVYDALTEKGYRVFFSRITLEDKLGQEYEPYIFAALNSAKIMLAFGTDYEYYNAVWVKNEWSRYLKLMAKDKTKHLIPCYKGIDAYDMPKEFAKLQAQDMGKVGAIQDLMRGIEKLLPRTDPSAPVQQVVQQVVAPADNRQSAQLDRGYMALEDGDWKKADGFFEEALNLDAHSAPAYIGKALVQEQCRNLHALMLKRLEECQNVKAENKTIQPEKAQLAHIEEAAQKYSVPGYLEPEEVKALYKYDFSYPSYISGREKQREDQKQWWENHKLLSRAVQFAAGDVARQLQAEKEFLLDSLEQRVEKAKKEEKNTIESTKRNYANFLIEADSRAEEGRLPHAKERENDYQKWCAKAQKEDNVYCLKELATKFDKLGNYKDSEAMAEFCRNRAKEEEAAEKEEQERQSRIRAQREKHAEKRKKAIRITIIVLLLLAIAGYFLATKVIVPALQHQQARNYLNAGDYDTGYAMLEDLGKHDEVIQDKYDRGMSFLETKNYAEGYKFLIEAGRNDIVLQSKYERGMEFLNGGYYDTAYQLLSESGHEDMVAQSKYERAMVLLERKDYDSAYILLEEAGRGDEVKQNKYDRAMAMLGEKDYDNAYKLLEEAGKNDEIKQSKHDRATELIEAGKYEEAYELLNEIGMTDEINASKYQRATELINKKDYESACNLLYEIIDYDGAKESLYQCAISLHDDKKDEEAQAVFKRLGSYRDSNEFWQYIAAENLLAEGKAAQAAIAFSRVGDYQDAKERCRSAWSLVEQREAISAGKTHTVALKSDGTVVASGNGKYGECNVGTWTNIVAVSAGSGHTVGLKSDGTVAATGSADEGQCNVSGWTDITAISAGGWYTAGVKSLDGHTVGLKSDGTVVATGSNDKGQCDVSEWTDIVAISAGGWHTVGLKSDGTVVAAGSNGQGQCDVSEWTDIVAISAGEMHTVGLKSDGTVVATGRNLDNQCNVSEWTDIVAVSASRWHTVGLKSDGTVVATKFDSECDVGEWTDIVAVSSGDWHTVGLKSDGTVVVVGDNYFGQCNVGGWTDLRVPENREK